MTTTAQSSRRLRGVRLSDILYVTRLLLSGIWYILRLILTVLARDIALPLLRRFGKQIAAITVGIFLIFNAPQVLGVIAAVAFIFLALKFAIKR